MEYLFTKATNFKKEDYKKEIKLIKSELFYSSNLVHNQNSNYRKVKVDKTSVEASKSEWMLDNIRIEKIILAPNLGHKKLFMEVSALLDVRHCPKLRFCKVSKKITNATMRK